MTPRVLGTSKGLALGVLPGAIGPILPDCQAEGTEAPAWCERPSYPCLFLSLCHVCCYYSYLLIILWALWSLLSFPARGQRFAVAWSLFTVGFTGMQ